MAISRLEFLELKRKLESIENSYPQVRDHADKVYMDMYVGEGQENPSVTTRLDRLERVAATNGKLFWAVLGTILAVVGDIISNHIHH